MKKRKVKSISRRKHKEGKHAALELSIGTIVILVLAMSMLILGLVLVRTIFTGAKYNVETMNKKVEAEINKLFVEDQRAVIYLPNRIAEVKQGDEFGLGFGIQNSVKTQKFKWQVEVADDNIRKKCGITDRQAEEWITTGGSGSVEVSSGQKYYDTIRFNIQEGSVSDVSTCLIRYKLVIKQEDGTPYTTEPFDVDIS
ncbi:MAG: hypothetical protein RL557_753 [archaeon]